VDSDETIHAELGDEKLVRHDRAGKWGVVYIPCNMRPYRPLSRIKNAVNVALRMYEQGGVIHFGRPGGKTFDRLCHAALTHREEHVAG